MSCADAGAADRMQAVAASDNKIFFIECLLLGNEHG
jgi:hypothetical protein